MLPSLFQIHAHFYAPLYKNHSKFISTPMDAIADILIRVSYTNYMLFEWPSRFVLTLLPPGTKIM